MVLPARPDTSRGPKEETSYSDEADWRSMFQPMYQALSGDDPRFSSIDMGWDDTDPEALDPWKSFLGDFTDEEPRVPPGNPHPMARAGFTLPTESDRGLRSADRRAARRGVDPGRKAGSGQLFDLARSQLGAPYVFGAAGPTTFDCSGFVVWAFSRAYGVALPHQALQQAQVTQRLTREELQPGDLIFYSYGRLGPGAIDHVEIYMGNGKQIGTSNPTEDLDIDNVDWDNFVQGGRVNSPNIPDSGIGGAGKLGAKLVDPLLKPPKGKVVTKEVMNTSADVPMMLSGEYGSAAFSTVLADVLSGDEKVRSLRYRTPAALSRGSNAAIKKQLYQGFMDAGAPELARMVGTRDFQIWINAESGWNPGVSSPPNNHGMRNDGLFQIWRGHEFNNHGQVAQMSPYEQAMMVVKYFDLTVADIRNYAAQIRAGSYGGWG